MGEDNVPPSPYTYITSLSSATFALRSAQSVCLAHMLHSLGCCFHTRVPTPLKGVLDLVTHIQPQNVTGIAATPVAALEVCFLELTLITNFSTCLLRRWGNPMVCGKPLLQEMEGSL